MGIDIDRAAAFLTTHGRVLDRRRFDLLTAGTTARRRAAVLEALTAYRNGDGGYGWGLEPDLRAPESQPAGAQHALATLAEVGEPAPTTPELLDWLSATSLVDGGLPFALPIADPVGCAPFFVAADATVSSLQITAAVTGQALRVARYDQRVRRHPWLARSTRYCLDAIDGLGDAPFAYILSFSLGFLDVAVETEPRAEELLKRLARFVPPDGAVPVEGGAEGETLRLLDLSGEPGRPLRDLVDDAAVEADLDRLESGQEADGGWRVDFDNYSEAAKSEWRGFATVAAVATLRANGR